jgi:hypothetical protein
VISVKDYRRGFAQDGCNEPPPRKGVAVPKAGKSANQGSGVMIKPLYAVIAAAIIAAAFLSFLSLAMQVQANASVPNAKADRADARPLGTQCSQKGWPYFEAACLRDVRNPYGQARSVRIVAAR